jgi:hypothetical protein
MKKVFAEISVITESRTSLKFKGVLPMTKKAKEVFDSR